MATFTLREIDELIEKVTLEIEDLHADRARAHKWGRSERARGIDDDLSLKRRLLARYVMKRKSRIGKIFERQLLNSSDTQGNTMTDNQLIRREQAQRIEYWVAFFIIPVIPVVLLFATWWGFALWTVASISLALMIRTFFDFGPSLLVLFGSYVLTALIWTLALHGLLWWIKRDFDA